jgi:hypothetical protein
MATCALMLCGVRCSCAGTNSSHPTVEDQHEQLVEDLMAGGLSRRHASIAAVTVKASYFIERKERPHPRRRV